MTEQEIAIRSDASYLIVKAILVSHKRFEIYHKSAARNIPDVIETIIARLLFVSVSMCH
jgi:hypothetical protein